MRATSERDVLQSTFLRVFDPQLYHSRIALCLPSRHTHRPGYAFPGAARSGRGRSGDPNVLQRM